MWREARPCSKSVPLPCPCHRHPVGPQSWRPGPWPWPLPLISHQVPRTLNPGEPSAPSTSPPASALVEAPVAAHPGDLRGPRWFPALSLPHPTHLRSAPGLGWLKGDCSRPTPGLGGHWPAGISSAASAQRLLHTQPLLAVSSSREPSSRPCGPGQLSPSVPP